MAESLPTELYNLLVCPADKAKVAYTAKKDGLKCPKCGAVYSIIDGIPDMTPKKK